MMNLVFYSCFFNDDLPVPYHKQPEGHTRPVQYARPVVLGPLPRSSQQPGSEPARFPRFPGTSHGIDASKNLVGAFTMFYHVLPCFTHLEKYEFVNGKDYSIYYGK